MAGDPEHARIKPNAIAAMLDTGKAVFKFVCAAPADVDEVIAVTKRLGIPPSLTWIMPEGTKPAILNDRLHDIADQAVAAGFNLTTRGLALAEHCAAAVVVSDVDAEGTATVGYLPEPGSRIVGLSKLVRVVQEFAARPQAQERRGDQIVSALETNLDTLGAACMIRCSHSCMTLRGAWATGASMSQMARR